MKKWKHSWTRGDVEWSYEPTWLAASTANWSFQIATEAQRLTALWAEARKPGQAQTRGECNSHISFPPKTMQVWQAFAAGPVWSRHFALVYSPTALLSIQVMAKQMHSSGALFFFFFHHIFWTLHNLETWILKACTLKSAKANTCILTDIIIRSSYGWRVGKLELKPPHDFTIWRSPWNCAHYNHTLQEWHTVPHK